MPEFRALKDVQSIYTFTNTALGRWTTTVVAAKAFGMIGMIIRLRGGTVVVTRGHQEAGGRTTGTIKLGANWGA